MDKRETEKFDEIFRDRLSELQAPFRAEHWGRFAERLDEGALEEEVEAGTPDANLRELDTALSGKMHGYEVPYRPEHWDRMEHQLNRAFSWPAYVLRFKALELLVFLLLFLALWQYLPEGSYRGPQAVAPGTELPPSSDENRSAAEQAGQPLNGQSANPETAAAPDGTDTETYTASVGAPAGPNLGSVLPPPPPGEAYAKAALNPLSPLNGRKFAPLAESNATAQLPAGLNERLQNSAASESKPAAAHEGALAALLPIPGRDHYPELGPQGLGEAGQIRPNRSKSIIRLGMFGSGEYNHIIVPASESSRLSESFERAALGYGGGLSLGFDFGRIELGTGAIYAARQYPVGLVYVQGSLGRGFEGDELRTTELNMINVPIHLRYDFVQRNRWRVYLLGGGSVQVAFQTNYYTANAPEFNFMPVMPAPPESDGAEKAIDRIRQNGVGWFEGGSFDDNAYLTANFGFGVERHMTERWSLFAQPVYQHSFYYFKNIDGLGPNNDRINSLSLLFGTRVRIR